MLCICIYPCGRKDEKMNVSLLETIKRLCNELRRLRRSKTITTLKSK